MVPALLSALLVILTATYRLMRWSNARQRVQYAGTGTPDGVPSGSIRLELWRLLTWVWLDRNRGAHGPLADEPATPGLTARELAELIEQGAPGAPAWARAAAGHLRQIDAPVELRLLAQEGLLVVERHHGVEHYRPSGVLGRLLARAPPPAVAALLRNPTGTTGVDVAGLPSADQARAIRTWLRETALA